MTLLHELVDSMADTRGDRVALRFRREDTPYRQLRERSRRIATKLAELEVGRGARVLVYADNRPAVIEIALACSRLGAIFVPVNSVLKAQQLAHIVRDCDPRAVVVAQLRDDLSTLFGDRHVVVCEAPSSVTALPPNLVRYEELLSGADVDPGVRAIESDPAAILYTSGTTGLPKGVVLSHRNLVAGARIVSGYLGNRPEDRVLAVLPLSFDYGLSQVTTSLAVGACVVLGNYSLPGALVQELQKEEITGLAGVPTMWAHVANSEWPAGVLARLRYVTNSGGALAPPLLELMREKLRGVDIFCMYGLTEAFRSTYLSPADLTRKAGSIGKALPTQEIMVLRPDGTPCDPGEVGELVHRGSLVTLGYWNAPEATALRFRPLRVSQSVPRDEIVVWSGDYVRRDSEGFIYFVGRQDGLIKTSGYRVSPAEIESVVMQVDGVVECCAVGVDDATLGQRIAVAIVSATAEKQLSDRVLRHCRSEMPAYMLPSDVRIVPFIPRTPNGKHDRAAVAAAFASAPPLVSANA